MAWTIDYNNELCVLDMVYVGDTSKQDLRESTSEAIAMTKELDIRGIVTTQLGTGTFIDNGEISLSPEDRARLLDQICTEFLSRASAYGFSLGEILDALQARHPQESPA